MKILGIETSCDETAVSVVEIEGDSVTVLSNTISSQINLHQRTGGVVPEVASRAHTEKIIPVLEESLETAKTTIDQIDQIAVTIGPGLIGSLLVGTNAAKTISFSLGKPIIPVNHIAGHIYASLIEHQISFPAVILTVSGGHTLLIYMKDHYDFQILGQTLDDAAGEAFDKVAVLLGLGYPGGPAISKLATEATPEAKEKYQINLPRPLATSPDYNFSFSGLKTAVLYTLRNADPKIISQPDYKANMAREFQEAATDVLVAKTIKAGSKFEVKPICLSGGVAANLRLRQKLEEAIKEKLPEVQFFVPAFQYCTDNAAMIALAGYWKGKLQGTTGWQEIKANPNAPLV